ncbi:MAG: NUDIX domain-containing protein [Chlorobi bacterium]|nr:NUDIX domain-containing protein [Chlorobiota bacterium]
MYKVFINDLLIVLKSEGIDNTTDNEVITIGNPDILKDFIGQLLSGDITSDKILVASNADELFDAFSSYFRLIDAAGGLVLNKNLKVLFIKRFGLWDFPKGKMEKGESPEEAAIREVQEETSVKGLETTQQLPSTWHVYKMDEKWVLKKTFWFEMRTDSDSKLIPQKKEDIETAEWRNQEEAEELLKLSYRSLREGFKNYFNY